MRDPDRFAEGIGIGITIGILHSNGAKDLAANLLRESLPERPARPATSILKHHAPISDAYEPDEDTPPPMEGP